jgi:tetratricopeptide (TPR) repeat protein
VSEIDPETADAKKVDEAIQLLLNGHVDAAEAAFLDVTKRTPAVWHERTEKDGRVFVRCWDQNEFTHLVTGSRKPAGAGGVVWVGNGYPRAWFYLGFIAVKRNRPEDAIRFLDRGAQLQPAHPNFRLEKARALSMRGDHQGAIRLYQSVVEMGDGIPATARALALRGKGVQLIDLGRLDEAERCFHDSLVFEPGSEVAANELEYIAQLRSGGERSQVVSVQTGGGAAACSLCGSTDLDGGKVANVDGVVMYGCVRCMAAPEPAVRPKRWWEVWRRT